MRRCIVVLIVLVLCGSACSLRAHAVSAVQSTEDATDGWWESIRGALPEEVAEDLQGIEAGEAELGFDYLFGLLAREVRGEGSTFLTLLATLLGVTVLGGVAGLLCEDGPLAKPIGLLLSTATALVLWQTVQASLTRATGYLSDLSRFASGLAPVMAAILSGGGAAGGAAATAGGVTTLIALLELAVGEVLAPLISVLCAFSLVGSISGGLRIDGIAATLRGLYMTVLGVVGMLAAGAITLQSVVASSADSLAMRTARYTVGSMIPFVGGTIGAALGTLGASLSVIKSSIGVGALIACISLTLPILLSLYFTRLSLGLSASVARMMHNTAGEKLLGDFRGIFDMTLAVTALSGVLFMIDIAVFLKTALPVAA